MSTATAPDAICPSCGAPSVSAYVHLGSYSGRCFACEWRGPATSWIAVAPRLQGMVEANLVDQSGAVVRTVAVGTGAEILADVASVAGAGGVVRFRIAPISA